MATMIAMANIMNHFMKCDGCHLRVYVLAFLSVWEAPFWLMSQGLHANGHLTRRAAPLPAERVVAPVSRRPVGAEEVSTLVLF